LEKELHLFISYIRFDAVLSLFVWLLVVVGRLID